MSLDRITFALLLLGVAGCRDRGGDAAVASDASDDASTTAADPSGDSGSDGDTGAPEEPTQAASLRASVKRKAPDVYARDLSRALGLGTDELCLELSQYDCTSSHRIALGGVDPYDRAVYEPLAEPGISSPLAIDRIALSACGERVARDLAGEGLVFAELADGTASADDRAAIVDRLVLRLLRRPAEPHELEAIAALADDPNIPDAHTWGQLACFAIATTLENVFY